MPPRVNYLNDLIKVRYLSTPIRNNTTTEQEENTAEITELSVGRRMLRVGEIRENFKRNDLTRAQYLIDTAIQFYPYYPVLRILKQLAHNLRPRQRELLESEAYIYFVIVYASNDPDALLHDLYEDMTDIKLPPQKVSDVPNFPCFFGQCEFALMNGRTVDAVMQHICEKHMNFYAEFQGAKILTPQRCTSLFCQERRISFEDISKHVREQHPQDTSAIQMIQQIEAVPNATRIT